ncbi:MAG: MFS transporter [Acidobacteriota bacterium]
MENSSTSSSTRGSLLMAIAFFGIFVYGLLTALPGTVIPDLERGKFLPNDAVVANFLLINAIGAVLAYVISGPITDKIGKKFTLSMGAVLVIAAMAGFALVVSRVEPSSARFLVFLCGFVLGIGANAIVSAGHALVGDVAVSWRDAALNLLDICFGLGLSTLPLIFNPQAALSQIFWILAAAALALVLVVVVPKFPKPSHPESFPFSEAKGLFGSLSFWLLAIALFMYVGSEVAVGKWVTTLLQKDSQLLTSFGLNEQMQNMARTSADFFKEDALGKNVADFALKTLSWFGFSLMIGRLISSFLLGVAKVNSFLLLAVGSAITAIGLGLAFNSTSPEAVRWGVFASGIGMGPIFPTSVGLASAIAPRIAGTAMSWVMGIGFAGLLVIPPAVGYISEAVGGEKGDVRKGLMFVFIATLVMLLLHIGLMIRERKRSNV